MFLVKVLPTPMSIKLELEMEESKDRILQLDGTIALADYFHAYLDTVKTKLIAACLVVVALILFFIYFFTLIGEQKILLQLSPLFIGLPIVGIVGQLLRIHASYRKYLQDLSESEKSVHYIFREPSDGFDIVSGKNFSHVAWDSVRSMIERPRYFRFVLGGPETLFIPKTFLKNNAEQELMREIISSGIGSKARLLTGSRDG